MIGGLVCRKGGGGFAAFVVGSGEANRGLVGSAGDDWFWERRRSSKGGILVTISPESARIRRD